MTQTPVPDDLPRSKSGRVPQWVIDEAQGRVVPDTSFRTWESIPRPTRRRRGGVLRRVVAATVVLGLVAGGATWFTLSGPPDPVAATSDGEGYAFLHTDPITKGPVGYDPCTPIKVEVRPDNAPPGAEEMLKESLDSIAAVTGLTFTMLGSTDRAPSKGMVYTLLPGQEPEPVLVAWSNEDESPDLAGTVAGYAGSIPVETKPGRRYLMTGEVVLDAEDLNPLADTDQGRAAITGVITHEVGHLVGLDHVDDPGELMYPQGQPGVERLGPGDLAGLRQLGQVPCN